MADVQSDLPPEALFGISFSDVFRAEEYLVVHRFAGAELVHTTLRPGASAELAAALVP